MRKTITTTTTSTGAIIANCEIGDTLIVNASSPYAIVKTGSAVEVIGKSNDGTIAVKIVSSTISSVIGNCFAQLNPSFFDIEVAAPVAPAPVLKSMDVDFTSGVVIKRVNGTYAAIVDSIDDDGDEVQLYVVLDDNFAPTKKFGYFTEKYDEYGRFTSNRKGRNTSLDVVAVYVPSETKEILLYGKTVTNTPVWDITSNTLPSTITYSTGMVAIRFDGEAIAFFPNETMTATSGKTIVGIYKAFDGDGAFRETWGNIAHYNDKGEYISNSGAKDCGKSLAVVFQTSDPNAFLHLPTLMDDRNVVWGNAKA